MSHVNLREYAVYGIKWARITLERAAEHLGWAIVMILKMLSIVLYGPSDTPTMDTRCSQMGPAFL
jgi:hypothetical protein